MGTSFSCPGRQKDQVFDELSTEGKQPEGEPSYWQQVGQFWWEGCPLTLANTMEWYEFAIYGSMEPWISIKFFGGSSVIGWVVFGLTFAMRPFGGTAFGLIADRYGRRPAVLGSLTIMCCATVCQGLTPPVSYLGPIWLITCRVAQGLATGGEVGSVAVFFAEQAPKNILGMSGILMVTGAQIGFSVSTFVAILLVSVLDDNQMQSWGWRVPFLLAILPGALTLYNSLSMPETEEFQDMALEEGQETRDLAHQAKELKEHWVQGLLAVTGNISGFAQWYLAGSYLQQWLVTWCGLQRSSAFWVLMSGQMLTLPLCIPFGWYADHYGLGKLNVLMTSLTVFLSVPMYGVLYQYPNSLPALIICGVLFPATLLGAEVGTYAWTASMFPTQVRGTAFSLYWNLVCPVGGMAPAICTLVGTPMFVGYYSAATGVISVVASVAALYLHEKQLQTGKGYQMSYIREEPY